ncbi:unnamed protein product [Meganyctiphanes norvegica]|uniref:Uncharacterized protein n=1 Tax=Meganyctiphanes norvegica TaxID=48144 RepID=A0AAV2S8H6_MEGNR
MRYNKMALKQFSFLASHLLRMKNAVSPISSKAVVNLHYAALSKCHWLRNYSIATEYSNINPDVYNPIDNNLDELLITMKIKYGDTFSIHQTKSLYQTLVDHGIDSAKVKSQLVETPDLLKYPEIFWKQTFQVFTEFDFTPQKIYQCIVVHPALLRIKPNKLRQNLLELNQIEIGRSSVLKLAKIYPVMYTSNPQQVKKSLRHLSTLFNNPQLKGILKNSPSVIFSPIEETIKKMTYIVEEMGLSQDLVVETKVLSKSLSHIYTRHEFLKRAGLYSKPKLNKDKRSHKKNAPLTLIMDTSDRYFGNKVSHLSHEEYQVFQQIMNEELGEFEESTDDLDEEEEMEDN